MICIECAGPVASLYTIYGEGNVRLTQCPQCTNFADKYVEHDLVIIAIDLILIKPQVYRHLLFNLAPPQSSDDAMDGRMVRFGLMQLLFDVYLTWAQAERSGAHIAAGGVLWQYCTFLLLCVGQTLALHVSLRLLARWWLGWRRPNALSTALFISSCIKLFPILMVIWAYDDVPAASRAVSWAVMVNNMEALRILLGCEYWKAATLALVGSSLSILSLSTLS